MREPAFWWRKGGGSLLAPLAAVYGAVAWVRYSKLVAPLSVWCNWFAWSPVLAIGSGLGAGYLLSALFPPAAAINNLLPTQTTFTGDVLTTNGTVAAWTAATNGTVTSVQSAGNGGWEVLGSYTYSSVGTQHPVITISDNAVSATPEPSTLGTALLGIGAVLAGLRR